MRGLAFPGTSVALAAMLLLATVPTQARDVLASRLLDQYKDVVVDVHTSEVQLVSGQPPPGPEFVSLRRLLGRDVDDAAGVTAGIVQDAMVDLSRGRLEYVLVDLALNRSTPDDKLRVPLDALFIPPDGGTPVLDLDRR